MQYIIIANMRENSILIAMSSKRPKSYRFDPETIRQLESLKDWAGETETAVIRRLIRRAYELEAHKRGIDPYAKTE